MTTTSAPSIAIIRRSRVRVSRKRGLRGDGSVNLNHSLEPARPPDGWIKGIRGYPFNGRPPRAGERSSDRIPVWADREVPKRGCHIAYPSVVVQYSLAPVRIFGRN
jgi:hypothetical protein